MKPSTSALIGAILASGGCLSLPAVAFVRIYSRHAGGFSRHLSRGKARSFIDLQLRPLRRRFRNALTPFDATASLCRRDHVAAACARDGLRAIANHAPIRVDLNQKTQVECDVLVR